jgi:predicted aspartyl protease
VTIGQSGSSLASLVLAHVAGVPAVSLVDTGASISLLSGPFYRRVQNSGRKFTNITDRKKSKRSLFSANDNRMKVEAEIKTSIKLGGIEHPATFVVVEKLVHEVIIGMDILQSMKAVIDTNEGTLQLFDGLAAVAMTTADEQLLVKTATSCEIPPFSEAVVNVNCTNKPVSGEFVIEGDIRATC